MKDRIVMHSDMNSFYASVEQAEHPELRGKPVAVAGKKELRHGIILTKSKEAKAYGVKTAEAIWEARMKCPDLIVVPPDYKLYQKYSSMARMIYYQYTDLVEPFGLDEAWLDLTGSLALHGGNALYVAEEISERVKAELGVTVSIGVSWNKVYAKFGSDYKKPDAITVIDRSNYHDIVWSAPVRNLIYVGPATERKLHSSGIDTIGQLAHASDYYLDTRFGKVGRMIRDFARGVDPSPVKPLNPDRIDADRMIKSYGNGLTAPHDITTPGDAKALLWLLSESVGQRLREDGMRAGVVSIGVRSGIDLTGFSRQVKLRQPTAATNTIAKSAWALLRSNAQLDKDHPVRALHVRASSLVPMADDVQLSLFETEDRRLEDLDLAIDRLRRRFGNTVIQRGIELFDDALLGVDIKGENTVHPVGFLHV